MTFPVIPEYPEQHLRNLRRMRIVLYVLFAVSVFANAVYRVQAENPHMPLSLCTSAVPLLLTLIIYLAHRNYLRQRVCFCDSDVRFIGRTGKTLLSIPYESITGVDLHYMKIAWDPFSNQPRGRGQMPFVPLFHTSHYILFIYTGTVDRFSDLKWHMNRYDDSCYDWSEILGDSRFIAMVCQEEAWNLLKEKVPEEKFIPK